MNNTHKIYIVVDKDLLPVTRSAALLRGVAIDKAENFLDALWPELYAEGYRVVEAELTIVKLCDDQEQ
ncbi:hypothetical protein E6Q11_02740 [Candidatus Dojkabacteria bacterium]|uniref:Uncharacterized protein n=1 Tax=Candidatus Dojkabacteria bacterium TaxID=2099670 RepID=A0A5C7J7F4_9BACT|nr:MAG: hypothetical protein E6Q11_02740 [Candidatus Dojkabacteria bacterium]